MYYNKFRNNELVYALPHKILLNQFFNYFAIYILPCNACSSTIIVYPAIFVLPFPDSLLAFPLSFFAFLNTLLCTVVQMLLGR